MTDAYLKQYVEVAKGEPARLAMRNPWPSLSQQRMDGCRRSAHESCGLGRNIAVAVVGSPGLVRDLYGITISHR